MSDINMLVENVLYDTTLQEAGILRGLAQGAIGTMGGPLGGAMSAGSRMQRNHYEDKLAALRGEEPKGATIGRGVGAVASGLLGTIPGIGGIVNAYQGYRASAAKKQYEKAAIQKGEASAQGPQYASVLSTPLDTSILSENTGKTPAELEKDSYSNWQGKFRIYESNNKSHLLFQIEESKWIDLTSNRNPSDMAVGDYTYCECASVDDVSFATKIGKFNGHGMIAFENGSDFTFSSDIISGKYLVFENSGFPGARYKLIRIS